MTRLLCRATSRRPQGFPGGPGARLVQPFRCLARLGAGPLAHHPSSFKQDSKVNAVAERQIRALKYIQTDLNIQVPSSLDSGFRSGLSLDLSSSSRQFLTLQSGWCTGRSSHILSSLRRLDLYILQGRIAVCCEQTSLGPLNHHKLHEIQCSSMRSHVSFPGFQGLGCTHVS